MAIIESFGNKIFGVFFERVVRCVTNQGNADVITDGAVSKATDRRSLQRMETRSLLGHCRVMLLNEE
jgi:hypothetical protein